MTPSFPRPHEVGTCPACRRTLYSNREPRAHGAMDQHGRFIGRLVPARVVPYAGQKTIEWAWFCGSPVCLRKIRLRDVTWPVRVFVGGRAGALA